MSPPRHAVSHRPAGVETEPEPIRDRGAASSLSVVLLTPVMVLLGFAAFQAAMWTHARTEARVIARDTVALVARSGVSVDDATRSATLVLESDTLVRDADVAIDLGPNLATVTITGRAPGILRGTWTPVSVTASAPVEGWVP